MDLKGWRHQCRQSKHFADWLWFQTHHRRQYQAFWLLECDVLGEATPDLIRWKQIRPQPENCDPKIRPPVAPGSLDFCVYWGRSHLPEVSQHLQVLGTEAQNDYCPSPLPWDQSWQHKVHTNIGRFGWTHWHFPPDQSIPGSWPKNSIIGDSGISKIPLTVYKQPRCWEKLWVLQQIFLQYQVVFTTEYPLSVVYGQGPDALRKLN